MRLFLDGWITAKIDYSKIVGFGDPNEYYHNNHQKICLSLTKQTDRIKNWIHTDEETDIPYSVTLAYEEIGVKFSVSSLVEDTEDRIPTFETLINRVVNGYKNLKKWFLEHIRSQALPISILENSERMLITTYNFLEKLDPEQKDSFIEKASDVLRQHGFYFKSVETDTEEAASDEIIKPLTLKDLEKASAFDFYDIIVIWDNIYLFVEHHLFRSTFLLDDPSLSVSTVAESGFICALKLLDLHYELEEYSSKIAKITDDIESMNKKRFPYGINQFREELATLEHTNNIIEDDLKEFTNFSEKIFQGLLRDEQSKKVLYLLRQVNSLPDSIYQAYGILEVQKLGYFSNMKRGMMEIRAKMEILESRFNRSELRIAAIVLAALFLLASLLTIYKVNLGSVADFIGILTFGITLTILILRFLPRSEGFQRFDKLCRKIKSCLS
jgi:hypothetical protein